MPDLPAEFRDAVRDILRPNIDVIMGVSHYRAAVDAICVAADALRAQGAAAEREACAQLAEQYRATYAVVTRDASCLEGETPTQVEHEPFADLIRARTTP